MELLIVYLIGLVVTFLWALTIPTPASSDYTARQNQIFDVMASFVCGIIWPVSIPYSFYSLYQLNKVNNNV